MCAGDLLSLGFRPHRKFIWGAGGPRASQNDGIEVKMAPVAINDQPACMHRIGQAPAWGSKRGGGGHVVEV